MARRKDSESPNLWSEKELVENALNCLQVQRDIDRLNEILDDLTDQCRAVHQKLTELEARRNFRNNLLSQAILKFVDNLNR